MLRFNLCLILLTTATSSIADDFPAPSTVTTATIYPSGASITRNVPFDLPAGDHRLLITDLPVDTPLADLRVAAEGLSIKGITSRNAFVPPHDATESQAYQDAEAHLEQVQDKLRIAEAAVETIRLEERAALTRVGFLESLGQSKTAESVDASDLRDIVALVGDETLTALKAAQAARIKADNADRALKDLRKEEYEAKLALKAVVKENPTRAMVAIDVKTEDATKGIAKITYNIDAAAWVPVYDFALDREAETVRIGRGALVSQNTGEHWTDVALKLSTRRPTEATEPTEIWPQVRRIYDPVEREKRLKRDAAVDTVANGEMVVAEPVAVAAAPEIETGGLAVTYNSSTTVSVSSGADFARVDLGTTELAAEITAQAVPLRDEHAYLMAKFTNGAEPILSTDEASLLVDNHYVGKRPMPFMAAGDEIKMAFGAIEGLRLKRHILEKQEGDRGFISKSNEMTESVRIEIENLTDQSWPLWILDQVPVSEQEDLKVEWESSLKPTEENVDHKMGVLGWDVSLAPGKRQEIQLDYSLSWPEGHVLQ